MTAEPSMDTARHSAAPAVLGTRWLKFWNYLGLPVGGIVAFLIFLGMCPHFDTRSSLSPILFFAVAFGLRKRRLWAWQWNWLVLAVVFVALLVPTPIRDAPGGPNVSIAQGLFKLLSIDWKYERLRDLAVPFAIRPYIGWPFSGSGRIGSIGESEKRLFVA